MRPLKLILEGGNLSGKSSIFGELEKRFPDCFALTIHGYFRPQLKKEFKSDKELINYLKNRLLPLIEIFREFKNEEVLFNRFHLTDVVYCDLFLGLKQDYQAIEKKLNEYNVGLAFLDVDDQAIKKRLEERDKIGKAGLWDKEFDSIIKKREAYRKAFDKSLIKRKVKIDTSDTTAEEAAKKILLWWKNEGF